MLVEVEFLEDKEWRGYRFAKGEKVDFNREDANIFAHHGVVRILSPSRAQSLNEVLAEGRKEVRKRAEKHEETLAAAEAKGKARKGE